MSDDALVRQNIDTNKKLIEVMEKLAAGKGGTGSIDAFSSLSPKLGAMGTTVGIAEGMFGLLTKTLGVVGEAFKAVKQVVDTNTDVWRQLSDRGQGFGNDILGMSIGAAQAHTSLEAFAKTITENVSAMAALGGGSGAAKKFGQSLSFMYGEVSTATDALRSYGYKNEEINELLAIQIAAQRGLGTKDKTQERETVEAMQAMAREMDLMARLTGESRKEQQEKLKEAATDSKVEARFRLIRMDAEAKGLDGAKAELAARTTFTRAMVSESANGTGQAFKEFFATGGIAITRAVGAQSGMMSKQLDQTRAAAMATINGDTEAALAASRAGMQAQIEYGHNRAAANIQIFSQADSTAAQAQKPAFDKRNQNIKAAIEKEMEADDLRGKTTEEKRRIGLDRVMVRLEKEQHDAEKGLGEGAGVLKATLQLEQRVKDVNEVLVTGLVTPLREKIGPGLKDFADRYLNATTNGGRGFRPTMSQAFDQGFNNNGANTVRQPGVGGQATGGSVLPQATGAASMEAIGHAAGEIGGIIAKLLGIRHKGTEEITGQKTEPQDTVVKLLQGERVLNPDEARQHNSLEEMMSQMTQGFQPLMKTMEMQGPQIENIAQQIFKQFGLGSLLDNVKQPPKPAEPQIELPKPQVVTEQQSPANDFGKDLSGLLVELNKSMARVERFVQETAENTKKNVSATQGLSNNRLR
jgi:hypothetical protein